MRKTWIKLMALAMTLMLLVGCGAKEETKEEAKAAVKPETTQEATEKKVSFDFNGENKEVTIPANPQRVVVIGVDVLDIMDSLGLKDKIVGIVDPKAPTFPGYLKGYEDVASIGSLFGDDLEAVAGLKPDLIIAGARTAKAYDGLAEIAPTVYFKIPGFGMGFKDGLHQNVTMLADIFNVQDKGNEVIARLDGKLEAMKEKTSKIEDPSALFLIVSGKTIGLFSDNEESRYGFVFNEFGFKSPATAEEIKTNESTHGDSVSFEFISAKNPNYMIVLDRGAATGTEEIKATDTLDNSLVKSTKAYKDGHIIYVDGTAWYIGTGGVQATEIMIDNLLDALK